MSQNNLQQIIATLEKLSAGENAVAPTTESIDPVHEELLKEYTSFLEAMTAPVQTATNQTTNIATPTTTTPNNSIKPAGSTISTTQSPQDQLKAQQELEKNLGQLKTKTGGTFDVKQVAQALSSNASPTAGPAVTQATKALMSAPGIKDLINRLK